MVPDVSDPTNVVAEFFADEPGVAAVWLFGSRARGRGRPDSDTDLGVLYADGAAPRDVVGWTRDMHARLAAAGVPGPDPVLLDRADPILRRQAIERGHPVVVRDRGRANAFRVRSWCEYWDLEPLRRLTVDGMRRHA